MSGRSLFTSVVLSRGDVWSFDAVKLVISAVARPNSSARAAGDVMVSG
jgi:hypothetical protein